MSAFPKGSLGAAALYYTQVLGWSVFPLAPHGKVPLIGKAQGGNGLLDASKDAEQIVAWWTAHPTANVGVVTGEASGLVVVDVDGEAGESALTDYGELPETPASTTGKGRHLLFARPAEGLRNSAGKLGAQLDIRGDGGYIVAPPSIHPSGALYRWTVLPGRTPLAELPAGILDRLRGVVGRIAGPAAVPARSTAVDVVFHSVGEGGRNQALAEYVGRLFRLGARELEVLELARGVNATKFSPPLDNAEVEAVVRSIANAHLRNTPAPQSAANAPATPLAEIGANVFADMAEKNQAPVDALPTMWPAWNRACRQYGGQKGWARGWHVIVAGGAGVGKSLVALNQTVSALYGGHSVGWLSLEMSREQLLLRTLGIATGRPLRSLEPGAHYDDSAFRAASTELLATCADAGARLLVSERPPRDLPAAIGLMQQAVDAGCRLIVVDYLQLVAVPGVPKRDEALTMISSAMQEFCYRNGVNTLVLSQLNRSTTANTESPPTLHGLAGSSALENDADQIVLLDHTSKAEVPGGKTMTALLDKNRHGPTIAIPIRMDYDTLRLSELVTEAPQPRRSMTLELNDRGHYRSFYEGRD
jgi:KaiC/GvpD/RAD55 family RecA-like ATPase